jgi:3',5'-cyclic AMP phosphodiesterase CpdA
MRRPGQLLVGNLWQWLIHYIEVAFFPRRNFATYKAPSSERPGIFPIPNRCSIGVAGDWGTGTRSAYDVADRIRAHHPDVTIHLGDVYYSGTKEEFHDYFLGEWPRGKLSTYTLNANHEMYSGGAGYFSAIRELGQEASYLCLENEHFRVLAIDTGYYSRVFPLLEQFFAGTVRLHPKQCEWLRDVVFKDPGDKRPVVLLSHHQWFSSFETEYMSIGRDMTPYLDRVLVWIWAHEHRFAGYGPFGFGDAPRVRARCIGHGGMPVELGKHKERPRNLIFTDERVAYELEGEAIGYCGYTLLDLDGPKLRIEYRDERDALLLEEHWNADGIGTVKLTADLTLRGDIQALVAPVR